MKITWDEKAKAVYVCLVDENAKADYTKQITETIFVDFAVNKENIDVPIPIGIELLNATEPNIEHIAQKD